jgi:hypothetical protein
VLILTKAGKDRINSYRTGKKNPTMPLIALPPAPSVERTHLLMNHALRNGVLERLYERRNVVEDLIRSFESYQKFHQAKRAGRADFISVERKCS